MTGGLVAMKAGPLFGLPVDVLTPVEEKFIPVVFGNKKDEKSGEKTE